MFVLTDSNIIYHSIDAGRTWANINADLNVTTGGVYQMYQTAGTTSVSSVLLLWL